MYRTRLVFSMGATAFAQRAADELHAAGATVRQPAAQPVDALTIQELQIAQLYLSARTVEWHLRKVFKQLGIRSRRQLHTALAARERVGALNHAGLAH
jgi:DNA-binding CsgD family transcriptional regulator